MRMRRDARALLEAAARRERAAAARSQYFTKELQAKSSVQSEPGSPLVAEVIPVPVAESEALVLQVDRAARPDAVLVPIDIELIVRARKAREDDEDDEDDWDVDGEDEEIRIDHGD